MQNDYLYQKRKPRFSYDTKALTNAVNELIHKYHSNGNDVIYIRHIIQNFPTNRLLFGYSIAGTEGAELYEGLDIVSDYCFDKLLGDALTIVDLLENRISSLIKIFHICVVVVTVRQHAFLIRLDVKNFYSIPFIRFPSRSTITKIA